MKRFLLILFLGFPPTIFASSTSIKLEDLVQNETQIKKVQVVSAQLKHIDGTKVCSNLYSGKVLNTFKGDAEPQELSFYVSDSYFMGQIVYIFYSDERTSDSTVKSNKGGKQRCVEVPVNEVSIPWYQVVQAKEIKNHVVLPFKMVPPKGLPVNEMKVRRVLNNDKEGSVFDHIELMNGEGLVTGKQIVSTQAFETFITAHTESR